MITELNSHDEKLSEHPIEKPKENKRKLLIEEIDNEDENESKEEKKEPTQDNKQTNRSAIELENIVLTEEKSVEESKRKDQLSDSKLFKNFKELDEFDTLD